MGAAHFENNFGPKRRVLLQAGLRQFVVSCSFFVLASQGRALVFGNIFGFAL